uniref:Uncharacterized protein n=1 Tax=Ignisphaera aggregans TaxID=334771 RepID=A0A7J3Z920_9CREN
MCRERVVGVIVFKKGKKGEVAKFFRVYLGFQWSRPIFEAKVSKNALLTALERLHIDHSVRSDGAIEICNEFDFKQIVVYAAVRQFIDDLGASEKWIAVLMYPWEVEFWFWKLATIYEFYYYRLTSYKEIERIVKAIKILYLDE